MPSVPKLEKAYKTAMQLYRKLNKLVIKDNVEAANECIRACGDCIKYAKQVKMELDQIPEPSDTKEKRKTNNPFKIIIKGTGIKHIPYELTEYQERKWYTDYKSDSTENSVKQGAHIQCNNAIYIANRITKDIYQKMSHMPKALES